MDTVKRAYNRVRKKYANKFNMQLTSINTVLKCGTDETCGMYYQASQIKRKAEKMPEHAVDLLGSTIPQYSHVMR